MKKQLTLLGLVLLISALTFNSSAKKWRVNNAPGISANYSTLVAAYNAAGTGDTLYLEGTAIPYIAPDTIKKKLVILGPGYFLADNDSTQANTAPANLSTIVFGRGSDGSVMSGVTVTGNCYITDASNLILSRNYFYNLYIYNYLRTITNILIKQNYFNVYLIQPSNAKSASLTILNNILSYFEIDQTSSTVICMNNYMYRAIDISNSEFYNNVVEGGIIESGSNNHQFNNIFAGAGTNANGNQYAVSMSNVFVGTPNSLDGKYHLKPASLAKGSGYNGVDIGPFGNNDPYILSGIPALPHIFDAKVENLGSAGTGLPVRLKVKSQK